MPLYEYQCSECNDRFENIQKFSDPLLKVCKKCGGALEQLISSPAIQFKGSGWYVTDYAKKGGAGEASDGKDNDPKKASDRSAGTGTSASSNTASGSSASQGADSSEKSKKQSKKSSQD